jgi:hypothetical protein
MARRDPWDSTLRSSQFLFIIIVILISGGGHRLPKERTVASGRAMRGLEVVGEGKVDG